MKHLHDYTFRVLLEDRCDGLKSATLLELELAPAVGSESLSDASLCSMLYHAAEDRLRAGEAPVLPAVSAGMEQAWRDALVDEVRAFSLQMDYCGARAREIHLYFEQEKVDSKTVVG